MKTVRRIGIRSLCRLVFLGDLCLLAATAVPVALIATAIRLYAGLARPYAPLGVAVLTLALHPVAAALAAALGAWLYNRLARRFGGIMVELGEE